MENKMSSYYKIGNTHIIETSPDNIYVSLIGDTLHKKRIAGINGTWFDVNKPADPERVWGVAVNDGLIVGEARKSSGTGLPYKLPRGTIICLNSGEY